MARVSDSSGGFVLFAVLLRRRGRIPRRHGCPV